MTFPFLQKAAPLFARVYLKTPDVTGSEEFSR